MKSIKSVAVLAAAVASLCALLGGAGAAGASATTLCVVGSPAGGTCPTGSGPGGAFTLTSSNATFNVGGGVGAVTCRSAAISGTAPAVGSSTSITLPVAFTWSGCSGPLGAANVAISGSCGTSTPPTMTFDYNGGRPYTFEKLPQGCSVVITFLAITCQVTIAGPQTIGNGTPGAGGQQWVNGSITTAAPSRDIFNNDVVTYTLNPACPGGPRTSPGTYAATYTVTTPATAPGMTVEP